MTFSLLLKLVVTQLLVFAPLLWFLDSLTLTGALSLGAVSGLCFLQGFLLLLLIKIYGFPRSLEGLFPGFKGSRSFLLLYLIHLPVLVVLTLILSSSKKLDELIRIEGISSKVEKVVLFLALSQLLVIPAIHIYPHRYLLHYSRWFAQPGVQYLTRLTYEVRGLGMDLDRTLEKNEDLRVPEVLELFKDYNQTSSSRLAIFGVLREFQNRYMKVKEVSQFKRDFLDLAFIETAMGVLKQGQGAASRFEVYNPVNIILPNLLFESLLVSLVDIGVDVYVQSVLEEEIQEAFLRVDGVREGESQEVQAQRMNVVLRLKSEYQSFKDL